ncbi:nuclear RNA export factor 1-like [Amphiura filiformis]|uniref:nuclear RNA export factor 1-like n=1 Tax=Amphiura filiformis TaxID=82378 RepID=UPI003B21340D
MPAPIILPDIGETTALPPIQKSFMVTPEIEGVLTKFIEHFYNVFDSSNRQPLLEAYHEQVRFSLTAAAGANAPAHIRAIFSQYIRDSRNLLRIDDGNLRVKLLKQGKLATVAFLNEMPQMQHDTSSFQVDVSRAEPNLLAFTVHGVFKDVQNKSGDQPLIAFSRFFITVPNPATGCLIVNDELCLRPPTSNQKRTAFCIAAPTPSPSPVTVPVGSPSQGLTPEQQAMVQQFILDSEMNADWSLKCLQENNWDYPASGQVFLQLKQNGSIPPEAFVK